MLPRLPPRPHDPWPPQLHPISTTLTVLPHFAWIVTGLHRCLALAGAAPIARRMNEFCPMPGCRVGAIMPGGPDLLHVDARGARPGGRCPDCGRASRAVHSHYRRQPADLPSLGRRGSISLHARRFYCRNPRCARRTFGERLPELVAPYARRTCRLGAAQGQVGWRWAARPGPSCCGNRPCRRARTPCCA
jgi:hypothetical protein